MANYTASAGSKIEYSATKNGTYNQVKGLLAIPAIGDTPNKIDTTSLDNTKYETAVDGLMPAVDLAFAFNMEDPQAGANIVLVHGLAVTDEAYYWKITYSNGVVVEYESKVKYSFDEVGVDAIAGFTMYHSPIKEIETTLPGFSL